MKQCGKIIGALLLPTLILGSKVASQTDWEGGPGVLGPVDDWGTTFYESSNLNYLYQAGRLSLSIVLKSALAPTQHHIGDMYSALDKKLEIANMYAIPGAPDQRRHVFVAGLNEIRWYENDGTGEFRRSYAVYSSPSGFIGYDLADFNSDGYEDLAIGDWAAGKVLLYLNDRSNHFSFYAKVGDQPNVHQVSAKDFDNDGDIDVVCTKNHYWPTWGPDCWFENDGTNCNFIRYVVSTEGRGAARRIHTCDIDKDGDIDFMTSARHGTWWFENRIQEDGPEPGFRIHKVDSLRKNLYDWIEDVNKDSHMDILTSNVDNLFTCPVYWENDGNQNFIEHPLYSKIRNPEAIVAIDIDYDGDLDIIQSFFGPAYDSSGLLAWYENDGNENFTYRKFADYPYSCDLQVADINGNGFLDLITSTHRPGESIDWWELFDYFQEEGELTSSILDAQVPVKWESIEWDAEVPRKTNVAFQVRTSNSIDTWPEWKTCKILDDTCFVPLDSVVKQDTRYLQYRVTLSTTDSTRSPFLHEVRITYDDKTAVVEVPESPAELRIVGDLVRYALPGDETGRISVFDVTGRRLLEKTISEAGQLKLDRFPRGLYFVRLDHATGTISRKVVLTR